MGALPDDSHLAARRLAVFTGGLYASPGWLAHFGAPLEHPDALLVTAAPVHALVIGAPNQEPAPWQLRRQGSGLDGTGELWRGLSPWRCQGGSPALKRSWRSVGNSLKDVQ